MSSRRREFLIRLGMAAAGLLFSLLLAEATLRLLGFTPERFNNMGRMVDPHWTTLLDCYPTNPRGYFDLDLREPATRARLQHVAPVRYDAVARRAPYAVEFHYNSLRFRDQPLGPKPPGVRRVMILGDSFTEGQGVREPDTCVRLLEKLLNRKDPMQWEVRNCGRRGTDFPALAEAFEALLPHDPDIVIYAMVLNDPDQSPEFHARQTYANDWILDQERMVKHGAGPLPGPWSSRLASLLGDRLTAWRVGRETTRWYLDMYGEPNRRGWERTQARIREMDRRVRERGGQFLVVVWPLLVAFEGRYPFTPAHDAIARFCREAGIAHHDLLPLFRGRQTAPLWVHPVDRHPNQIANRLAAEDLLPVVQGLAHR